MTVTTLTSEELEQDPDGALRATIDGPVMITEDGAVSHVLMAYDAYLKLLPE